MQILYDEHHIALVVLVPFQQGKKDIQKSVGLTLLVRLSHHGRLLVQHDAWGCLLATHAVVLMVFEHANGSINPYAQIIDERLFLQSQFVAIICINQVFGVDMSKHFLITILSFKQHLRQNEHAVVHIWVWIEIVAHITQAHLSIHILKHTKPFEDVCHVFIIVLVFFYQYAHNLAF